MKTKPLFFGLFLTALSLQCFLCSCRPSTGDRLHGRWGIVRILERGEDITSQYAPYRDRWIEFEAGGLLISGGPSSTRDTGAWRFDAMTKVLYLEEAVGLPESHWIVRFQGKHMNWQGTGKAPGKYYWMEFIRRQTR